MIINSDTTKDLAILEAMRKVLTAVIRDTTPPPGMRHPLTDETIQDVRVCLGLITAREKELGEAAGIAAKRPYYTDETPTSTVVQFDPGKGKSSE
ncbi:segregation and condensation protein A [Sedimenticola sp.]|uniref:segregation and condensation protein A n=1 Tax=Sedimenticola sp. TaxID=1940285 RepID=UPI003D0CEBDE